MSTTPTPLSDRILVVTHDESHGYGHIYVHVDTWDALREKPESSSMVNTRFHGFKAQNQYDSGSRGSYAWCCGFESRPDSIIVLADMVRTYRMLQDIDKKMTQYTRDWGLPTTFGQYLVFLGKAIGIPAFCWQGKYGYNRSTEADHVRYHVDTLIHKFQNTLSVTA